MTEPSHKSLPRASGEASDSRGAGAAPVGPATAPLQVTLSHNALPADGPGGDTLSRSPDGAAPAVQVGERSAELPAVAGYEILEELGRGGMGVVYKARHLNLNRIVALKMLLTGQHAGAKERDRFDREAGIVAQFHHPHIVQVYEKGDRNCVPYLAMEYCEGGSLKDRLGGGSLPPREAARTARSLAEAIAHAHARNVVHRDLKPDNVLLTQDGILKITDFGLALLLDEQTRLTSRGAMIGTPGYMAPEQAAGWYDQLGPAADVYGLGAILYTLLTGRPPFVSRSFDELLRQVLGAEPIRPRNLDPNVPRDLETICLKCLEKQPRHRYATAQQLADDLGRFLDDKPIAARPVGSLDRAWRWCRRNRVVAGLATAAVALLVLAAVSATIAAFLFSAKADAEARARATLEEQLYDNYIAVAERELTLKQDVGLAGDLLGKCEPRLRGWEWDYLMRLRDGDRPPLADHKAGLWRAVFSPDGQLVATASIDGTVKIWDAATGRMLRTFRGHAGPIGRLPELLPTIPALSLPQLPRPPVMCLAFSPDGRRIASGSFSPNLEKLRESRGVVKVWDVATLDEVVTFQEQFGVVLSLAFSPDGRRIASSSINADNSFTVWNADTGKVIQNVHGHKSHIHRLGYSFAGRLLATASTDGAVKLWDAASLRELRSIAAHRAPVVDLAFAPDDACIASGGEDGLVRVWQTATGSEMAFSPLRGHTGSALGVAFSPDGKRLASGGFDKTVRLWDAATGKEKITLRGHTDMVWSVAFSPDGRRLVSASFDKEARLWDATPREEQQGEGLFTITGHKDRVSVVAFSSDGRYLASASLDGTVRLWDGNTGAAIRALEGHDGNVWGVAFSPDGQRLASASWDHKVKIWDAATGRELLTFAEHTAPVQSVAFSPDGQRVVSGSWDASVKVWEAGTGKVLATCEGDLFPTVAVAFSPDGKRVASGRTDRSVIVWDAATGKALFTLKGHEAIVPCVAFSPDGNRLVSASWDHTLKVWDVAPQRPAPLFQSRELLTLKGHGDRVNGAAFSPDGARIASASEDKTVRLWDAATGEEVLAPCLHRGLVWSVAFAPDGKRVATGCWSSSGQVKTWDVERKGRHAP